MMLNLQVNKLHYVCANWQNTQKVQITATPRLTRDYDTSGNSEIFNILQF